MNINSGTGRQLKPVNFSVEIYLRFNLGPLHALGGLVKYIVEKHGNSFSGKQHQWVLPRISTSSLRKKSELNCHIPFNIFD